MVITTRPTLVAAPIITFAQMRAMLVDLGWVLESESEKPILRGEPELAVFTHTTTDARIHYTFNPVVRLRVLQFHGTDAVADCDRAGSQIPSLGSGDISELLKSADVREVLLGLFAADELHEIAVIDQVIALQAHQDAKIAHTAERVRDALIPELVEKTLEDLAAEKAAHPDRSILFEHLPSVEQRRQILRWLMHDFETSNAAIDEVLRSALVDADSEVRVTAVIAAARLGAVGVLEAVRRADIPTSTSEGADERNRHFYESLRRGAVKYLGEKPFGGGIDRSEERRTQFMRAITGELEVHDAPTLLIHSLITPLALGEEPASLPEAVECCDGEYFLRRSGLQVQWVAPVSHWLGEDSARAPVQNPIREVTPSAGFFLARVPVSRSLAEWLEAAAQGAIDTASDDSTEPLLCTWDEAAHICALLAQIEGVNIVLPTADEWEMAARGPDGRRFPWGNALLKDGPSRTSPWMLERLIGHSAEWTRDVDVDGMRIICGGQVRWSCARRLKVSSGASTPRCAVRPLVVVESL